MPAEDVDRAGEPGEGAGDRHRQEVVRPTLIPPYRAASGLNPTARTS